MAPPKRTKREQRMGQGSYRRKGRGEEAVVRWTVQQAPGRFFIPLKAGAMAVLQYSLEGAVLVIEGTYTPPSHRGRGLADALTRRAIAYAAQNGLKVRPVCSYAARFFDQHPELHDIVE